MKKLLLSVALVWVILSFVIQAQTSDAEKQAKSYADNVLQMRDQRKFREIYEQKLHTQFKQQMSEDQWLQVAQQVAEQTGNIKSRTLESSGQSMGTYKFSYDSSYENGKAFDDVYVTKENGAWKVIGILIRPNI